MGVFTVFEAFSHLVFLSELHQVVGLITRHDLTHERLHEIRHRKKAEDRRQRKKRRSQANAAAILSPVDDLVSHTSAS